MEDAVLELADAHAEVCRLHEEALLHGVSPEQHVHLLAGWDESHAAYLVALQLAGKPLRSLHRPPELASAVRRRNVPAIALPEAPGRLPAAAPSEAPAEVVIH
eukprot:2144207-Prymnesium_polylepis.1